MRLPTTAPTVPTATSSANSDVVVTRKAAANGNHDLRRRDVDDPRVSSTTKTNSAR
jgi:hypothetical protein